MPSSPIIRVTNGTNGQAPAWAGRAKREPRIKADGEIADRVPPHTPDAERMTLRAIMTDNTLIDCEHLTASDFYVPEYRTVFVAMAKLHEDKRPLDVAHVHNQLIEDGQLDEIGGRAALAEILTSETLPTLTETYLREVRDQRVKRELKNFGLVDVAQAAYSKKPAREVIENIRAELDRIVTDADGLGIEQSPKILSARELVRQNPRLRESVIDGILRRGETMNLIAAPKVGKSWLALGLALSVVTGLPWLGQFPCQRGKVLLIDNELHNETISTRLQTVARALSLREDEYDGLKVLPLRGKLRDIHSIASQLRSIPKGTYELVILDSFYRALPPGTSETDNGAVAGLYNEIDAIAGRLDCSWGNIHHASKGNQAEKGITDVGSGAGAQSRAADAHLILREHQEPGVVVLDGVVRSFPPLEPVALRWGFPLWSPDGGLNPAQLRQLPSKQELKQIANDTEGKAQIMDLLSDGTKKSVSAIRRPLGMNLDRCNRLLNSLEEDGQVGIEEVPGSRTAERRCWSKNGATS